MPRKHWAYSVSLEDETRDKAAAMALERGIPMRKLVTELIEREYQANHPATPAPKKPRRKPRVVWTEEVVIEALKARHQAGKSMQAQVAVREDARLYNAAYYVFGSWVTARRAAGIERPDPKPRGVKALGLRTVRKSKGMSRVELARRVGKSYSLISSVEHLENLLTPVLQAAIAQVLECDPLELEWM